MSSQRRFEYHWLRGQVVQEMTTRPEGIKQWRFAKTPLKSLVAVMEEDGPSFKYRKGPAFSIDRLAESVTMFHHGVAQKSRADLGKSVPDELALKLAKRLETKCRQLTGKYRTFATEPDMNAHLAGLWEQEEVQSGDWSIRTSAVTFNPETKEPLCHADIGVVFIVNYQGVRTIKALWIQGKRTDELPDEVSSLPRLDSQIKKMLGFSKESYAGVYTRRGVHLFHGTNYAKELSVADVFHHGIICKRGDRSPRFVALASDCKFVLDVVASGPGPS